MYIGVLLRDQGTSGRGMYRRRWGASRKRGSAITKSMTPPSSENRGPIKAEDARMLAKEKLASIAVPLRSAITSSLTLRPASSAELAEELGVPVERVRYHLNRMRRVGLVDLQGKTRRRGVSENLYSVDPRNVLLDADDAARLPPHHLDRSYARLLRLMFREVAAAVRAETFRSQIDCAVVRFALPLDRRAWREFIELQNDLLDGILTAREASLTRLKTTRETPVKASAMILSFEHPPRNRR